MDVVVTGIGLISVLGDLENTWKELLAGESGIQVQQPFLELGAFPLALVNNSPAKLVDLTQCCAEAALRDANLPALQPDCGVVVGSSRGNQGEWERLVGEMGKVGEMGEIGEIGEWLETLPHAAAIAAARRIQTRAAVLSPMAACATGMWAIAQGYELVRTGQCDRVLAGAVEAPITPLTLIGFDRMGALAKTGAYPFDQNREGLVLGEGGAILVLESVELAARRGARIYGRLLGFGLTADGYHVSAPEPGSWGAISAVKHCLDRSHLSPSEIDYIHAHGTATRLNDYNEAYLLGHLFSNQVPISSTKGATGHTIGASGALGVAFCLMALRQQQLPPCVGLKQPEFDLNFVRSTYSNEINNVLCLSFGFGGQNGAIAIGKYSST